MWYRNLGKTGVTTSVIAFGAGPVAGLMTGSDFDLQRKTVERAVSRGITWFDTAAGYGLGASERNLGRCLNELGCPEQVQIATKVRLVIPSSVSIWDQVFRGWEESRERLGGLPITLFQLHNGVTLGRGDEPHSVSEEDLLGPGGIAESLVELRKSGAVRLVGLTGTGNGESLTNGIRSGLFDTIQVPYNLLNPSAGQLMANFSEVDYGNILSECQKLGMGAFAIRVFAGGAILGNPPSGHTLTTPFFPLSLYQRDLSSARSRFALGPIQDAVRTAIGFALSHPAISAAILGMGGPEEVDQAVEAALGNPP